jgi:anaerobic ribonucleoside-triphosphate reductase activating protein
VTLLGGEPFLQAEGLADVAQACRKMGLSVMVFSGYQLEELDDVALKGHHNCLMHRCFGGWRISTCFD